MFSPKTWCDNLAFLRLILAQTVFLESRTHSYGFCSPDGLFGELSVSAGGSFEAGAPGRLCHVTWLPTSYHVAIIFNKSCMRLSGLVSVKVGRRGVSEPTASRHLVLMQLHLTCHDVFVFLCVTGVSPVSGSSGSRYITTQSRFPVFV